MATFEPVLLKRIDKPNSTALDGYRADGGYQALEKALKMAPDDLTTLVKDSGFARARRRWLLGRVEVEFLA
jgi:NADH-quinone oxidoreductase subunit F